SLGLSPLGRRLVETTLFEIVDECRVYKFRHVGPAKLRASINPISPFRTALDGQRSGPRILPSRIGPVLCHLHRLRILFSKPASIPKPARRCQNYGFTQAWASPKARLQEQDKQLTTTL